MSKRLDRWVPAGIRGEIETRYYAKINAQADFECLARDPDFMADPANHVGIFADHGVVHARDVANHVLAVLENCHGVLIARRSAQRMALMQGYGVLLAYFHDIGMIDFSLFGRTMHPEFAAQAVFDSQLDDVIEAVWQENCGGLAWHLRTLFDDGLIKQDPKMVLREMLALSICHSKSKIPVELLNDPNRLRERLVEVISTELGSLYALQESRARSGGNEQAARYTAKSGNRPFRGSFS